MAIIYLNDCFLGAISDYRRDPNTVCNCCKKKCEATRAQITITVESAENIGRLHALCQDCRIQLQHICDQVTDGRSTAKSTRH